MSPDSRIASTGEVPDDTTFLFTVRDVDAGEEREAILVRTEGEVCCWLNHCQHFTHVKLDKGSGATMRDGEVVCTNHGAYFESDSGRCTFGPCEGAYLDEVDVTTRDGEVFLTDDGFEFVAAGPATTADGDLSSTSNVEF